MKLTILVAAPDPTEPPDLGPPAPSIKVYADSVGSKPGDSGFSTRELPTPASGQSDSNAFTSKLHDMASDTVDTFGGTADLAYQVSLGSRVRINQPKNDQLGGM